MSTNRNAFVFCHLYTIHFPVLFVLVLANESRHDYRTTILRRVTVQHMRWYQHTAFYFIFLWSLNRLAFFTSIASSFSPSFIPSSFNSLNQPNHTHTPPPTQRLPTMALTCSDIFKFIFAVIFPPLGVLLEVWTDLSRSSCSPGSWGTLNLSTRKYVDTNNFPLLFVLGLIERMRSRPRHQHSLDLLGFHSRYAPFFHHVWPRNAECQALTLYLTHHSSFLANNEPASRYHPRFLHHSEVLVESWSKNTQLGALQFASALFTKALSLCTAPQKFPLQNNKKTLSRLYVMLYICSHNIYNKKPFIQTVIPLVVSHGVLGQSWK